MKRKLSKCTINRHAELRKFLFSVIMSMILAGQIMILAWSDELNYSGHPDPEKWRYEEGFIRHRQLNVTPRTVLRTQVYLVAILLYELSRKMMKT